MRKYHTSLAIFLLAVVSVNCKAFEVWGSMVGKVNDSSVRLRSEPNLSSQILKVFPKGVQIKLLEASSRIIIDDVYFFFWYKVDYNQTIGWIYSKYVETDSFAVPSEEQLIGRIAYFSNTLRPIYTIKSNVALYDSSMKLVDMIPMANTKLIFIPYESSFLTYDYKKYEKRICIMRNRIIRPLTVSYNDQYYFVSQDSVTPYYIATESGVIYAKYGQIIKSIDLGGPGWLCTVPSILIIEVVAGSLVTRMELPYSIEDEYYSYEDLHGFVYYKGLLVLYINGAGGKIGGDGVLHNEIRLYQIGKNDVSLLSTDHTFTSEH